MPENNASTSIIGKKARDRIVISSSSAYPSLRIGRSAGNCSQKRACCAGGAPDFASMPSRSTIRQDYIHSALKSSGCPTPIDGDNRAGHEGCFGRTEVEREAGDLAGLSQPADRLPEIELGADFFLFVLVVLLEVAFNEG